MLVSTHAVLARGHTMPALVNHRAGVQGAVTAVEASVGATVNRGDVLLRLESMKMEFTVEALADGVVRA
ncbi:MAG TPA: acetyl-CoA carboxylase biotin carboxyl carrier protein subunit, partial [Burkholderiaceae bacterium]|nr:acetyl-CoA carboxylase biotin carboxyl carrier protein subunit [Burkholderiaceae bacterium]